MKLDGLGILGRGKSKHRPRNDPSLYGGPYPFVQTGDVKEADLWLTQYSQTYNEEGLAQSKLWPVGTLCITIAANIAETAILKIPACFPDSVVGFIPHPGKAEARFIKYYIDTIKLRMQNVSKGTTQDNLSLEKLTSFDFDVPAYSVQERIADILSAYDDLIENNTRRIQILEEMAQRIYREWFVHFRFPGHENVRMVESELGPIPEGWAASTIEQLAEITMGQSPPSEFYNKARSGLPFHQGVADFGARFPVDRTYCTMENRLALPQDILMSVRAPVGRLNISTQKIVIGRGLCAIRSRMNNQAILFQQLKEHFQEEDTMGSGTIFKAVTKQDVCGIKFVRADPKTATALENWLRPAFRQLEVLSLTNTNLRTTRDLLLPKLISGEIPVSVAENTLSEAGLESA